MSTKKVYLAADIGAGSGRVIAGIYEGGKLHLEEIHRFDNQPIALNGSLHWQSVRTFGFIKEGIAKAVEKYGTAIRSVGVDTWGVDYGLLDSRRRLMGIPYCYRDSRTDGLVEAAEPVMTTAERYAETGIQHLAINTLYQLLAERDCGASCLEGAQSLVFIPDLINFWLCGVVANEITVASTGELLDAKNGQWSERIIKAFGLRREMFGQLVEPGVVLGELSAPVADEVGAAGIKVVTVPSHDTAAAIAACPLSSENALYISSGTWSLMGVESSEPVLSAAACAAGLTNERGVEGTTRLLANIGGFWILQQCKLEWDIKGLGLDFGKICELAVAAEPFKLFIDPNDDRFMPPGNMLGRVENYFRATGQVVDMSPGVVARAIFEGLALSYRKVAASIGKVTGKPCDALHIIGGGGRNALLNQMTADAVGCRVIAGPIEGSSLGNILAQLKADGEIESIRAGREVIRASFELASYEPSNATDWSAAAARFEAITKSAGAIF